MTFKEFLKTIWHEETDEDEDDYEITFDIWLDWKDSDEIIGYGQAYGDMIKKQNKKS